MATITGKTAVVMAKQLAGDINFGDKVIITDNLYTISDINDLFGDSGLKIKLEKTAAATQFVETAANLLAVLEKVEKYTGAVTATAAASTAINDVAGLTTGVVTATILNTEAIDATLLVSLTNVKPSDKISYTPINAAATEATDIVAIKKILPLAVLGGGVSSITGGSADVAALKAASNIVNNKPVTVTPGEAISAADANAIAKNSSAVTADVKAASAASLNSALKDLSAADTLSLTVSGKSATAADLKALVTKIGAGASTVDADALETITGNVADIKAVLAAATATTITIGGTPEIKVSGTISAADAGIIAGHADAGIVTAKVTEGSASSLNVALGAGDPTDKLSLTVINNSNGSATDAADLVSLDGKTASKITVNAKAIEGSEADVLAVFVTNKNNFTGLGNKAVEVTGGAVTDVYNLNAILNATSGVVTAEVSGLAAALKAGLTHAKGTDKLTIEVTDTTTNAADLKALDAKTALAVDATDTTTLIGSIADIKTVLKSNGIALDTSAVDIVPTGKISAADANTLSAATDGEVAATVTAGSASALNKALKDVVNTEKDALTLTVTGATATTADLTALTTKTSEPVDASAVKTITGSLADLGAFYVLGATEIVLNASSNATISGTVAVADLATLETLLGNVPGKVTATVTPSTAAVLAAALNANGKPTDALTFNVVEDRLAGAVVATDAEDLVTLDNQTSVKVKVDATQIEGDYAELEHIYISGKAGFSNLGNEIVKIDDTQTAARVDSILKSTTGVVTATVAAADAAELVRNLKNAKNDNLALEITTGSVANAADLKALDAKTIGNVDASNIAKLVGTAADVKAVLSSTGVNIALNEVIDVNGTISAADANTIANGTNGIVTATVKADTAKNLSDALDSTIFTAGTDKISLTVTGASADAADLTALNAMTVEAVNAAAIKTVTGTATSIAALYALTAADVSGLGNEAVSVNGSATEAQVVAINSKTTGVINVSTVETAIGAFALADLGDLAGITGLYTLDAETDGGDTAVTLSIKDLLAANDSKKSFDFNIFGDSGDNDTVTFTDVTGWTQTSVAANTQYTFTNDTTKQVITVNLDGVTVI